MERIALLLDHKENRRLLESWLGRNYQILPSDATRIPDEPFDLGILDGPALDRLWEQVQVRREAEGPVFLPFLLVTARQDVKAVTRHLWRTVDELILTPIEKVELQARVEILLRARRSSLESEQRYHALAEASPAGIFIVQDECIVYANPTLLRISGRAWPEVAGAGFLDFIHPQDREKVIQSYQDAAAGKKTPPLEMRILAPGRERWLELHATSATYVGKPAILGIALDITERKQAEEERERLLVQVQAILDTVPQGVLLLDGEGRILHANHVAKKDLGVLAGAKAQVGDVLTHLGDRPLAELLTSPPIKGLWHEVKADERTFEVIARPVEQGPALEQWVLVINDATREREIQAQLQQQERLAAVGQLAGGIAHDFNNIMAVIILYAGMLARSEGLTERDRERVAVINQQGWHATRLIQQILDFSRQAVLEQRPLDLLPLLKEQVKLLERTLPERIEIVLASREEEYVVSADLTRMQQMIMNLALNARDAMPEGGTLRIGLERIEVERGKSPLLPEMEAGEWVRLTVSDTGTGIAPDVLPHIFDPFFTTKAPGEGTGLGLAQVDGIVSQHGGRIGVKTEVGKGTTFTIYLPALAAHPVELPTPDVSTMPQGRGEVVLVVEDEEAVRTALVRSLEQINYRALEAANGEQALALMEERGEQVDLVLSDVVMPVMGGVALLHALRQKGWETPVILLTGHATEKGFDELRAQGLSAWLSKPPSLEQLAQAIAGALSG